MPFKSLSPLRCHLIQFCYYTQSKVSLGYCAQIADMSKEEFIRYLGANGVSIFHYDDEQEFIEKYKEFFDQLFNNEEVVVDVKEEHSYKCRNVDGSGLSSL